MPEHQEYECTHETITCSYRRAYVTSQDRQEGAPWPTAWPMSLHSLPSHAFQVCWDVSVQIIVQQGCRASIISVLLTKAAT